MYIVDRDGVLFDTCRLNIEAYSQAMRKLNLELNMIELEKNIHSGKSFSEYCLNVWPDLGSTAINEVKLVKSNFFNENLHLARLNSGLLNELLLNKSTMCLLTRATESSTLSLLRHFNVSTFGENVYSTQTFNNPSKMFAIKLLEKKLLISSDKISIIDDSINFVEEAILAGYNAIHYEHFCSFESGVA
jgi:phosphoglycolate phosphatase-like HAD superfamily hydrolase